MPAPLDLRAADDELRRLHQELATLQELWLGSIYGHHLDHPDSSPEGLRLRVQRLQCLILRKQCAHTRQQCQRMQARIHQQYTWLVQHQLLATGQGD